MTDDARNEKSRPKSGAFSRWLRSITSPRALVATPPVVEQPRPAPVAAPTPLEAPRDLGAPRPLRLERYQALRLLDRGVDDEVVLAQDSLVGAHVTVRLVHGARSQDPAFRARLFREVAAARNVAHPHIARIFEVHPDDDRVCLCMQTFEGTLLEDLLRTPAALSPARIVGIARNLVKLLVLVHAQGLTHGGLSPSSVVIGANDTVHLIDLGAGAMRTADELADHCAPEVRAGALPTPRADVYAVGATLARWSRQAVHDAPYLALLTTACAASLDARFADAKALLAALEQMPLPAAVPAAPASAPATQPSPDDAFRWTSLLNPDGTVRATR